MCSGQCTARVPIHKPTRVRSRRKKKRNLQRMNILKTQDGTVNAWQFVSPQVMPCGNLNVSLLKIFMTYFVFPPLANSNEVSYPMRGPRLPYPVCVVFFHGISAPRNLFCSSTVEIMMKRNRRRQLFTNRWLHCFPRCHGATESLLFRQVTCYLVPKGVLWNPFS